MKFSEYRELVHKKDYLETKNKFCKNYSIACLLIVSIASIFWSFKDMITYNLLGDPSACFIIFATRLLPLIASIAGFVAIKKNYTHISRILNIIVYTTILGAFAGIAYLHKYHDCNPIGDGWLVYYVVIYVFSLEAESFCTMPIALIIYSFLIWFTDAIGWIPCGLGSLHIITTGMMMSTALYASSIFFKKSFAEYFLTFNHLEDIAKKDSLTFCFNRFIISEITNDKYLLNQDCTIFILDIDNFKQINTKYGHNIGDEALIETVHALNRSCRGTNDKVIRYGGDEFVIYLEGHIDPKSFYSRFMYQKKHTSLEDRNITHSIGACFGKAGENIYDVIANADEALYTIKNSTKNDFAVYKALN